MRRIPAVRREALLVVVLALVGGGCAGSSDEVVPPGGARTYLEALDLSTPSAAAETFLDAFARDDFMTVWLVLHPTPQLIIVRDLHLLQPRVIVDHDAVPRSEYEEIYESFPPGSTDGLLLFDALMLAADEHDAFLVDLSGPVRVTGETLDGDRAQVSVEATGVEGAVTLHMSRAPWGRWHVSYVEMNGEREPLVMWPDPMDRGG